MTGAAPRTPLYPDPPPGVRPIRVAVVTAERVPHWVSVFLRMARHSRRVDLHVVATDAAASKRVDQLPMDLRAFLRVERLLLRTFLRIRGRTLDSPLEKTGLPPDIASAESSGTEGGGLAALEARLRVLKPDLVLLLGPRAWMDPVSALARLGCWLLDGDLLHPGHAGLALLLPILRKQDATEACLTLQDVSQPASARSPSTHALASSWGATRHVSFSQHRDQAFVKLPAMLLRALRTLADSGSDSALPRSGRLCIAPCRERFRTGDGMRAFGITLKLMMQARARRLRAEKPWFVVLPDTTAPMKPDQPRMAKHRALVAPGRNYWADPYPLTYGDERLLFLEEFVDGRNQGVITCLRLHPDDTAENLGVVLDEPFHLSYPQVFAWQGQWYMTVESCEADRVSLYRASDFPRGWTRVADLLESRLCVDPTLFHQDGLWYLFANVSECGGNPSDELFLFMSEQLEGPYRPHPANPIVTDVRSARPAGRLFVHEGRLIRPAQCCAPIYGSAVVFNEVQVLSPTAYAERVISRLDPLWSPHLDGCHTYNRAQDFEVLDAHGEPPSAASRIAVAEDVTQRAKLDAGGAASHPSRFHFLLAASMWPWYI